MPTSILPFRDLKMPMASRRWIDKVTRAVVDSPQCLINGPNDAGIEIVVAERASPAYD